MRLGLFTKDLRLSTVLASTLGRDFEICSAACIDAAKAVAAEGAVVVWLVDIDSEYDATSEWKRVLGNPDLLCGTTAILMTTDESRQDVMQLAERNGYDWFRKPPAVRELKVLLRKAHDAQLLKGELESARRQLQTQVGLDQLSGSSAKMQVVYDLVRRIAKLDASVLVTGESGTGKELIARAIHNTGNRAGRPFVAISCGAIPETLIEAELFGHERGAFTGTVAAREGYLEKAGDGTLFLDEIGELSLNTQVKLLRVLQQREFSRLGSSRPIPLRARVLFATHRDLTAMVAEGTFRKDLFYRVNVMNVHMPPLRNRSEDILMLAQIFLRRYSEMYRKPITGIDPDAVLLLRNYAWPGNVRELENVMQRAVIMAEDEYTHPNDLPPVIQSVEVVEEENDLPSGSFDRLLRDYKIKLVNEALVQCNGNKTLAAQSLSISRAYLHRLLRPSAGPVPCEAGVLTSSNPPLSSGVAGGTAAAG